MKYAQKLMVVPYVKPPVETPENDQLGVLSKNMNNILVNRKLPVDIRTKLYGKNLNKFLSIVKPELFQKTMEMHEKPEPTPAEPVPTPQTESPPTRKTRKTADMSIIQKRVNIITKPRIKRLLHAHYKDKRNKKNVTFLNDPMEIEQEEETFEDVPLSPTPPPPPQPLQAEQTITEQPTAHFFNADLLSQTMRNMFEQMNQTLNDVSKYKINALEASVKLLEKERADTNKELANLREQITINQTLPTTVSPAQNTPQYTKPITRSQTFKNQLKTPKNTPGQNKKKATPAQQRQQQQQQQQQAYQQQQQAYQQQQQAYQQQQQAYQQQQQQQQIYQSYQHLNQNNPLTFNRTQQTNKTKNLLLQPSKLQLQQPYESYNAFT